MFLYYFNIKNKIFKKYYLKKNVSKKASASPKGLNIKVRNKVHRVMDMVATSWRLTPQSLPLLSPKVKSFRVYSSSSSSSLSLSPIIQKTSSLIQNSGVIACLRANR